MYTTLVATLPLSERTDGWVTTDGPLWLLFWAALIGPAVWLVLRRRGRRGDPLDRARELLAERFARGELTGEEYRLRLDELNRSPRGG
jgi:putative membrane protein